MFGLDSISNYAILTFVIKAITKDYFVDIPKEIALFGAFEILKYLTNGSILYKISNDTENTIGLINSL